MLQKMQKRLANKDRKGFTLVEVIVVLVILAILAAIMIPALTGYIDKAKERSITAETRSAVMSAQTLVSQKYGEMAAGSTITVNSTGGTIAIDDVAKLSELPAANITSVTVGTGDNAGRVTGLVYTSGGKTCTYSKTDATTAGTYTVA